jgi:hypothetical protein
MLKYLVTTSRSGFENQQTFDDLTAAEVFYKSECEQIGAPVTFCSFDPDDDTGRLTYIETYNP